MNFDLLSIGEMVIDFTPGNEKDSYVRNPGGAPANVAIAMSRLGKRTAFCGMVGDDDFGWFLIRTLESDNVEVVCRNPTSEAFTTMAFMSVNESGERSFTFARKPGADMLLRIEDVDLKFINSSKVINAGSCSLSKGTSSDATEFAMKTAHEKNKLVSFDVNYRDLLWDSKVNDAIARIRSVLPSVDFLHVSEEEVFILGGEEKLPAVMKENNITVAVLTLGERGQNVFMMKKYIVLMENRQKLLIPAVRAMHSGVVS